MILKTYGIENLVDWKAQINVGKAKVIVHFTGGAITRYGVTPAEYSTADPMMHHVIEGSDYYKSGRIKLMRTAEVADDAATKARKSRDAKRAMRKVAEDATIVEELPDGSSSAEATEEPTAPENPTAPEATGDTEAQVAQEGEEAEATDGASRTGTESAGMTEVEVSCLQDAQDYLKENFNVPTTAIRSYEKAQVAAAEHGVVFVGGKF